MVNTDTGEVVSYSRWVFENTTVREQLQKPTGKEFKGTGNDEKSDAMF